MKSAPTFNLLFIIPATIILLVLITGCSGDHKPDTIRMWTSAGNPLQDFGISKIDESVDIILTNNRDSADLIVITSERTCRELNCETIYSELDYEGFAIRKLPEGKTALISTDQTGVMYGLMDISEQMQMGKTLNTIGEKIINPATEFRGIKFNLPWNSYRTDQSLQIHESTIRDLNYWKGFLDMMAENRFNALTLWNLHPFSYMIRAENFPEACPYNDEELKEWQEFWHSLFRMAADRGIRTYVFNWNIMVSSAFAEKYKLAEYCLDSYTGKNFIGEGDYSPVVQQYMCESVAQLLREYPELTGLGISQNERMEGVEEQVCYK